MIVAGVPPLFLAVSNALFRIEEVMFADQAATLFPVSCCKYRNHPPIDQAAELVLCTLGMLIVVAAI